MYKTLIFLVNLSKEREACRTSIIAEVFDVLLDVRVKTAVYAYVQFRGEPLTWQDLYIHSGIKEQLGVSEKTLASVLDSWIKQGILKKEKAPFPWKTKYRLIGSSYELDRIKCLVKNVLDRSEKWDARMIDKHNVRRSRQLSKAEVMTYADEVMEELMLVCRETFWKVLNLDFQQEEGHSPDPYKVAVTCFTLVAYILHAAANLHSPTREYIEKNLSDELTKGVEIEKEKVKADNTFEKLIVKV